MTPRSSFILVATCLGLCLLATPASWSQGEEESPPNRLPLSDEFRLTVERGRNVVLEVQTSENDRWPGLAERFCSGDADAESLQAANDHGGSGRVPVESWIRVPFDCLNTDYRAFVLHTLFPEDRRSEQGWVHVARKGRLPTFDEGLWQVAEWFTGDGSKFSVIADANELPSPELKPGQEVLIPDSLLHPAFLPRNVSDDGSLQYGTDDRGPFAAYRLKPGEALYSAVVLRFTGRTSAQDVAEVAEAIRVRSNIRDLTDIPAGYEIKIPLKLVEPEHLPPDHPRRLAAEATRAAVEAELAQTRLNRAKGLEGVVIVLDPGHGGQDLGAQHHGVWEHDHVYDIACRLRERLQAETKAEVHLTLVDSDTGCAPAESLKANKGGAVQTDPPFAVTRVGTNQTKISANLRWYLANSIYREARSRGVEKDRVLFLSLHADARHPSLRGLMVYLPGADLRKRREGSNSPTYRKFAEVREKPYISFSSKERIHDEAVSRKLGRRIVKAFRQAGLPVQPREPLRDKIVRGRNSRFVPAVIRGNQIPTKVLVEVLNLRSADDARLLKKSRTRQVMADALLSAIFQHFGEEIPEDLDIARLES